MGEQSRYQVRFDWGVAGAAAVGDDADVLVWVDALEPVAPPLEALPGQCAVVATGLAGVGETAAWVLALQEARGARTSVAVVDSTASDTATRYRDRCQSSRSLQVCWNATVRRNPVSSCVPRRHHAELLQQGVPVPIEPLGDGLVPPVLRVRVGGLCVGHAATLRGRSAPSLG